MTYKYVGPACPRCSSTDRYLRNDLCIACTNEYQRAWAKKNHERTLNQKRTYRENNREKCRETNRSYKRRNKEKVASYNEAWRLSNPERTAFQICKSRAKQEGHVFDIRFGIDLPAKSPDTCEGYGIRLSWDTGLRADSKPSIDRIDSRKGYVPGNVRWVSWKFNNDRRNLILSEAEAIYLDLKKYKVE